MKHIKYTVAAMAAMVVSVVGLHAGSDTDMKDTKEIVPIKSDCEKMGHFFLGIQAGADFANAVHTDAFGDIGSQTLATAGIRGGYIWSALPFIGNFAHGDWVNNLTFRTELEANWSGDQRPVGGININVNNAAVLLDNTVGYKIGKFEPYVGGAVGFSNTWVSGVPFATDSSDISLLYGPIGGIRYHIDCHWQLFGEYKFLWGDDKSFEGPFGATVNTHTSGDHVATAGVTYVF